MPVTNYIWDEVNDMLLRDHGDRSIFFAQPGTDRRSVPNRSGEAESR